MRIITIAAFSIIISMLQISFSFGLSYYLDITKEVLLQSLQRNDAGITFDDWNVVFPNPGSKLLVDQVNDMVFRFDILEDKIFYIKYNNQKLIKHNTSNNKVEEIFHRSDKIITDIVIYDGRVFISIIPDGQIYVYDGDEFSVFYTFESKYVWDMHPSPFGLAVITGNPAKAKIINYDGSLAQSYGLADINGSVIHFNPYNDMFYAGTSNNGIVYEIDPLNKKIKSKYQKPGARIKSIRSDGQKIYFAEITSLDLSPRHGRPQQVVTISEQDGDQSQSYNEASSESSSQFQQFARPDRLVSSIYMFNDNNRKVRSFYSSPGIFYDFAILGDYAYILSDEPCLIRVKKNKTSDRRYTSYKVDSMLFFLEKDERFFISTGYPGKIFQFYPEKYEAGEWLSDVLTMNSFINFGNISFDSDRRSFVSIRVGNTFIVDNNWSEWYRYSETANLDHLPKALYFQIRYEIGAYSKASIGNTRLFVSSAEIKCHIKDINISKERLNLGPATPRQRQQHAVQRDTVNFQRVQPFDINRPVIISWNYENIEMCGDLTSIKINIRDHGSNNIVFSTEVFNINRYELDRGFIPDGIYYAEIRTSSIFNANPEFLSYNSGKFVIDNTPPSVVIREYDNSRFILEARDSSSIIALAFLEYENKNRTYLLPEDGIFDSRIESFIIERSLIQDELCLFVVYDLEGNKSSILLNKGVM